MESKKINQLATELTPALSDLTIIGDPSTGISKKITLSQMASLFTGTVEEYPNVAAFPLVGVADTIYIALDTNVLYRWDTTLTSYVELSPNIINSLVFNDANGFDGTIALVGSVATLTITTALTTGSVGFIGASGALLQDNANFFWDDTNNRLGIGTNAPTTAIDVFGSGIIGRLNGTSTNNSFLGFASAGSNKWSIGNVQSDHRFRIYSEANTAELVSVLQTGEFGIGIANPTTKLHIDGGASALIANLDANVSVAKSISFRSDNSNRINLEVSGTESGSNAGMDFFLRTYTDAGALLETPFSIVRSTGVTTIKSLTLTNALSVANGGTGLTSYTIGDLIYASGSTTLAKLADVATGNALISGGVGVAPSWGKIGLTTHVSGTLPVANGGTGVTSLTSGHILFGNGTSALTTTSNFFWDNVSYRLGLLNSSPSYTLDVNGTVRVIGASIFSNSITASGNLNLQGSATRNINFYDSSNTNINAQIQYDQISSNSGQLFFSTNNGGTFSAKLSISPEGNLLLSSGATIYNSTGALFIRSGTSGDLILGAGGSNDKMRITTGSEVVRGTIREFASSVSPPSPYTADLRLIITHNPWGGNSDSGTVYVEYQGRAYGNNQTTTAFGVITYRLSDNGISVTSVSTAGVTVSNVTISADVSSNYVLRLTFSVAQSVDRASIFARTTNSFVSLISVDTV